MMNRPHTTVVLALSADGKIADVARKAAEFSSSIDRAHLERQVAEADAILFGAGTLRAHGSAMSLRNSDLIAARNQQQKPDQPLQIVCTRSGNIPTEIRFFQQKIPRWLLTTKQGAKQWENQNLKSTSRFDEIITFETANQEIDWEKTLSELKNKGIENLAVLGGGELVAALFQQQLLDELWLTICPVLLGGKNAPTAIEGIGVSAENAQQLKLLSVETIDQEVFLHYSIARE
ncbi:RibD family protein [Dactylococcopsis salina]|uniref:Pyrimidine reductase, riboflavin biosynthesis n=1 Tax=Dactylococcopsis salina (strain PCC 8305) TaxID=13035 RepID=K9Z173_DACS8|nr:RibD family protein [Dactylococcopsis salina]AFZ52113.1 pyrimidine reductase, riboflavin biosynthesis [Dactylococcopsis salina PCC 8305]